MMEYYHRVILQLTWVCLANAYIWSKYEYTILIYDCNIWRVHKLNQNCFECQTPIIFIIFKITYCQDESDYQN